MKSIRTHVQANKLPALLLALALAFAAAAFALPGAAQADELNGKDGVTFTVNSFEILDSDGVSIPLNQGDDPANYDKGLYIDEEGQIRFSWTLDTGSYLVQAGDTITIPVSCYMVQFAAFVDTDIFDAQNNNIGTIKRTGGNTSGNLVITLSDNAVGHNQVSGSFTSSKALMRKGVVPEGTLRTFEFNNQPYLYLAEPTVLVPIAISPSKAADSRSSSRITWRIWVCRDIERKLTDPQYESDRAGASWVRDNLHHTGVYVEDEIADEGLASVSLANIRIPIHVPLSATDPTAASRATIDFVTMTGSFTQVTQTSGEAKDAFRTRVQNAPLQYGVYKDGNTYTVMVNLGDWPNSSLTFDNTGVTSKVNGAPNENGFWTDETVQLWKQRHGAGGYTNEVDGKLTDVAIYINANYDTPVVVEVPKSNTASLYQDGAAEPTQLPANSSLLPTQQSAVTRSDAVRLVKFDEDSKLAIEGATFTLERNVDGAWEPHTALDGSTSWTTNASGVVEIEGLVNGEYRFVETAAAEGYDATSIKFATDASMTNEAATFTIDTSAAEGVLLYASNAKGETPQPETVDVSGTKTWEHGTNPEADRPAGATILLLADGKEVDRATVTADNDWAYSFEGLPKYAEDGTTEIEYTIDEEAVEGYEKKVDGYNVTNTFKEPTTPPAPEEKKPLLSVKKTTEVTTAKAGDTIPYTITIANTGEGDATGAEVVDTMAEGLEYVSDDADGTADGQTVTWTVDVAAGETRTITIQCKVAASATGKIVNSVLITPNDDIPVVPQEDTDEETITVTTPNTSLTTGDDDPKTPSPTTPAANKTTTPAKGQTAKTADAASAGVLSALLLTLLASGAGLYLAREKGARKR